MTREPAAGKPTLLVLASTYPRWQGDHEPGFVHELTKRMTDRFDVVAVVPSAPGAPSREILDGVEVIRYRYALRRWETLVNDGGITTNLRRHRWKVLLVPTFVLGQAWRAWRVLRTRRVDAVHAHWLIPQGLIAALLRALCRRMPAYMVTSHGADLFALRGSFLNMLKRFVVRRSAATTVVSGVMKEELGRIGINARGVEVQPMGVDLRNRFLPDLSVPRSTDEILFVGRLVEKKGVRHLIDAMPAVITSFPGAHLTIAGFGPEEATLRAQVRQRGLDDQVRFVGAVPQAELPALYRRAAVLVAPFVQAASGDQEGLGLVSIEAIGCGCPVILSDLPATRDVLANSSGFMYVPQGDSSALAKVIQSVLASPGDHRAGAAANRQEAMQKFDWVAVSDRYAGIIRQLAGPPM